MRKAAAILVQEGWQVDVVSVTSWSELARDGIAQERRMINAEADVATPWITQLLSENTHGPLIAATDYVRSVPESIRAFVPGNRKYLTLGTDGFGRSDTRAELREFFAVDAKSIVQATKAARSMSLRQG